MENSLVVAATVGSFLLDLIDSLFIYVPKLRQWKIMNDYGDQVFKEKYIECMTQKTDLIENENFQSPNPSVIIPALSESLLYINEESIRNMFANLIAASFDKSKTEYIHPGFIGIIKQLSPADASLLDFIKKSSIDNYPKINGISISDNNQHEYRIIEMHVESFDDIKQLALAIDNLTRLGLMVVESKNTLFFNSSDEYGMSVSVSEIYEADNNISKIAKENNFEIYSVEAYLTVLGESFLKVCV